MRIKGLIYLIISAAFLSGCGSSTGSRYEKEKEEETKKESVPEEKPLSFDMSPYHSTIEFDVKRESKKEYDIWYGFDSTSQTDNESTIDTTGFRVEVLTTDDLDEANNMKSEVIFRVKQNTYVIFDPPFYRVRAGDFESRSQAENLSFKLKQLGYSDSRVVSDSIKVRGSR